jgi:hypothetical protein
MGSQRAAEAAVRPRRERVVAIGPRIAHIDRLKGMRINVLIGGEPG